MSCHVLNHTNLNTHEFKCVKINHGKLNSLLRQSNYTVTCVI